MPGEEKELTNEERKELWDFLKITFELRKYHHSSLWEEEKHFTWWISIIFSIVALCFTNKSIDNGFKLFFISLLCLFGGFIAYLGYSVVRREGKNFLEVLETYTRICKILGLHESRWTIPGSDGNPKSLIPDYFPIREFPRIETANKSFLQLLLLLSRPREFNIRDCFQLILLFSAFFFLIIFIRVWITFLFFKVI